MDRNKNVMVNIAPDGLETAIIKDTSDALEIYEENAKEYISRYLKNTQVGKMLFNVNYKRSIVDSNVADSILYNIERNSDGTVKKR